VGRLFGALWSRVATGQAKPHRRFLLKAGPVRRVLGEAGLLLEVFGLSASGLHIQANRATSPNPRSIPAFRRETSPPVRSPVPIRSEGPPRLRHHASRCSRHEACQSPREEEPRW
jgi:hypothetical protein